MKINKKRILQISILLGFVVLVLTGCVSYDESGAPTGWVYEYLGQPTAILLDWLAGIFGNSYGMAIIIVTLITRLIMLPSSLRMTKSSMMSASKMELAQPEIKEIQDEMQATKDPQIQAQLQQELRAVYDRYDISMFGDTLGGCLPLLLQMPIISAVYAAIRSSQSIAQSSFLGINLGERSIVIVVIVVLIYALQGWMMQKGQPKSDNPQAQQTSNMMMLMNPLMLGWVTWASSAGLGLYFLVGGVFAIAQQLYMNKVVKPKIQAEVDEKRKTFENSQPKRKRKPVVNVQETSDGSKRLVPTKKQPTAGKRRNEGKQRRK